MQNNLMTTNLYTHPKCIEHDMGPGHPECPDRLIAIMAALDTPIFDALVRKAAPKAALDDIARMHPKAHVQAILDSVPVEGRAQIDADTSLCPASGEAALRGVGAVIAAVDDVMSGNADNAFCAVRPPGHHAEPEQVMGFCLFNNVAIAAAYARDRHGVKRVAVIDFDVHHGNGTETMFKDDPDLFYASTHQMPLFPGTGSALVTGVADNIVNVALEPFSGPAEFRAGMDQIILPQLEAFNPDLIIISAGFDAHQDDPLAQLNLGDDDYIWITKKLMNIAARCCNSRLVSSLEGGYALNALARSTTVHIQTLMNYKAE